MGDTWCQLRVRVEVATGGGEKAAATRGLEQRGGRRRGERQRGLGVWMVTIGVIVPC